MVHPLHPLKFDAVCPKEAFDVHEQETRTRMHASSALPRMFPARSARAAFQHAIDAAEVLTQAGAVKQEHLEAVAHLRRIALAARHHGQQARRRAGFAGIRDVSC